MPDWRPYPYKASKSSPWSIMSFERDRLFFATCYATEEEAARHRVTPYPPLALYKGGVFVRELAVNDKDYGPGGSCGVEL